MAFELTPEPITRSLATSLVRMKLGGRKFRVPRKMLVKIAVSILELELPGVKKEESEAFLKTIER